MIERADKLDEVARWLERAKFEIDTDNPDVARAHINSALAGIAIVKDDLPDEDDGVCRGEKILT
jgi:hypothetical protein